MGNSLSQIDRVLSHSAADVEEELPVEDASSASRYRRYHSMRHFQQSGELDKSTGKEFDPEQQTKTWVKQDLKKFDQYALQKCYGGVDPVEEVFGYNIWFVDDKDEVRTPRLLFSQSIRNR